MRSGFVATESARIRGSAGSGAVCFVRKQSFKSKKLTGGGGPDLPHAANYKTKRYHAHDEAGCRFGVLDSLGFGSDGDRARCAITNHVPAVRTGEQNQPVEWAYKSEKAYQDPFNEVDVDVVFDKRGWAAVESPHVLGGRDEWR